MLGQCNWLMCKQRSSHTANPYYKITTSRERNVGILSGRLQSQAYGLLHSVLYFSFEKLNSSSFVDFLQLSRIDVLSGPKSSEKFAVFEKLFLKKLSQDFWRWQESKTHLSSCRIFTPHPDGSHLPV